MELGFNLFVAGIIIICIVCAINVFLYNTNKGYYTNI